MAGVVCHEMIRGLPTFSSLQRNKATPMRKANSASFSETGAAASRNQCEAEDSFYATSDQDARYS